MYLVISDIHGDLESLQEVLSIYEDNDYKGIIIAGDILGSSMFFGGTFSKRDQKIVTLLNEHNDNIIAVKGNNDLDSDMKSFDFEVGSKFQLADIYSKKMLLSHGHVYDESRLPYLGLGDIYISGHTHKPQAELNFGIYMLNPGSISLPRGGFPKSYGQLTENGFKVFDFDGELIKEVAFNDN